MSDEDLPPTHRPWGAPEPVEPETQPLTGQAPPASPGSVPPTTNPYGAPAPPPPQAQQQPPFAPPPNPYPQPGSFDQYVAPNPYGAQPYGAYPPAYGAGQPEHPSATTAMVLGIVGLVGIAFCGGLTLVVSPFAWVIGRRAVREIDAEPGRYSGRDKANAGKIMGMIGTILLALGVLAIGAFIVLAIAITPSHVTINQNDPTPQHHGFAHS
jgi:hypothetical protein